jgi:hypothetical protein
MNCLEFVIILLPAPNVPIFLKKKEILPLMGEEKFCFNLKRNVILEVEVSME